MLNRRCVILSIVLVSTFWLTPLARAEVDPLPSWNDGTIKSAIREFVAKVTIEGSSDYVAPAKRVAVFDNDGTLWSEQPFYFQLAFAIDRVKAMAPEHPEWKTTEPFKSILSGDIKGVFASGKKGVGEIMAVTHAGMTTDEFAELVENWIATARHPKFDRPYNELVYQPMVELLAYLRANDFKTFIVSGGGVEFMRPWVEDAYGIPPEQVVGTSGVVSYVLEGDKPVLEKKAEIEFVDDGPGKPVGINRFIGQRPIFAVGNSDGDLQMLQWTTLSDGPRFGLIVHHTDAEREFAYDRKSHVGKLDKALDEASGRGWNVIDMKSDWKNIYPEAKK